MKIIKKSDKLQDVRYDVRGPVVEEAARLEEGGMRVLKLNIGNPAPFGFTAPEEVIQDIRDNVVHSQGYSDSRGIFAARKAIADDLNARYAADAAPEDFFIGCGAAPELCAVLKALAVPGGEVLAIAPYFPEYKPFSESAGLIFKVVPPDVPDFQIKLDQVEEMLTENTAAISRILRLRLPSF